MTTHNFKSKYTGSIGYLTASFFLPWVVWNNATITVALAMPTGQIFLQLPKNSLALKILFRSSAMLLIFSG
jgi:hypothetical protein